MKYRSPVSRWKYPRRRLLAYSLSIATGGTIAVVEYVWGRSMAGMVVLECVFLIVLVFLVVRYTSVSLPEW